MKGHYDDKASFYVQIRKSDPRISQQIHQALDGCDSILNVGAGTGSYEPEVPNLIALEPSMNMIRQRKNQTGVIQAYAEEIPFADKSFDAVMAVLTIHHWSDLSKGLAECKRIARKKVIILTWDPESDGFWLTQQYFPQILEIDRKIFPTLSMLQALLGSASIEKVLIPADCKDGFLGSYWKRPEAYLKDTVRAGISSFSKLSVPQENLDKLQQDILNGYWSEKNAHLLSLDSYDLAYRLIIADTQ